MPAFPRYMKVRDGEIATYHVWSRTVYGTYLCGNDHYSSRNFDHRRGWIEGLGKYLAGVVAVDLGTYAILNNHKHAMARTRPDLVNSWSDEECAWRYKRSWPAWDEERGEWWRDVDDADIRLLMDDPQKMKYIRAQLSRLSFFMARWKEPIARKANGEVEESGHFWNQRFSCREIVSDDDALRTCLYNDLNQMKAGMAQSFLTSHHSAIRQRILAFHAEQAEASHQCMQREQVDYGIDAQVLQDLFLDCYLTPISDQAPMIVGHADDLKRAKEALILPDYLQQAELEQEASADDREEAASDAVSSEATDDQESGETATGAGLVREAGAGEPIGAAAPSAETGKSERLLPDSPLSTGGESDAGAVEPLLPVRSQRIHQRLLFLNASRPRATDNAFLAMPVQQYFKIAEWTWERYKEQHEIEAMDPSSFEWHNAQRQLANRRLSYLSFGVWFDGMLREAIDDGDATALMIQSLTKTSTASSTSDPTTPAQAQVSAHQQRPQPPPD